MLHNLHIVKCIQYHRACHCRHKYHWVGLILQSTQIASLNYFSPSKLIRFVWIQTNTMHKFLTLRFVVEFAWAQYKFAMHHMLTAFKLPQEFPLRMRKWLVPVQIKKNLSHRLQCNGQSSDGSILTWRGQHFKFGWCILIIKHDMVFKLTNVLILS